MILVVIMLLLKLTILKTSKHIWWKRMIYCKMKIFGFAKIVFFVGLSILSNFRNPNSLNVIPLRFISMNNQPCKARPEIINVNSNNSIFYPFSIKTSKCSGSCNDINGPQAKICVTDIFKNLNLKVFNLISRTNETRHIKWHKIFKCKRRLDAIVWNNKRRWNKDKCRCECKELFDQEVCDKGYIFGIQVIVNVSVINYVMLVSA